MRHLLWKTPHEEPEVGSWSYDDCAWGTRDAEAPEGSDGLPCPPDGRPEWSRQPGPCVWSTVVATDDGGRVLQNRGCARGTACSPIGGHGLCPLWISGQPNPRMVRDAAAHLFRRVRAGSPDFLRDHRTHGTARARRGTGRSVRPDGQGLPQGLAPGIVPDRGGGQPHAVAVHHAVPELYAVHGRDVQDDDAGLRPRVRGRVVCPGGLLLWFGTHARGCS